MSLPDVGKFGVVKNPLVKSPFIETYDIAGSAPPATNRFLLMDGTDFLLMDGTNFLLMGT